MENELEVFTYEGCPLHYRLVGPEDASLVVLTHGGMVDHHVWDLQAPALIPRYRVLLWDVRGHGRSRPGGKKRSIPQVAEDLRALLNHLGYRQAVLVGLSAGGLLVQEFAYRYPDRTAALVVAGQTCWTRLPAKIRLIFTSWYPLLFVLVSLLIPWRLYLRILMRQGAAHSKAHTRAYLWDVFSQWSKLRFARHVWYARGGLRHEPSYRIQQPLLITHGEHEMDFVRTDAAAWAERDPQSRYAVIPDAGHVVNMDNPDAFNAMLLEFLAEVEIEMRREGA